jgi:hypothetical protein
LQLSSAGAFAFDEADAQILGKLAKIASTPAAASFVSREFQQHKVLKPRADERNSEMTFIDTAPRSYTLREHKKLVFLFGVMILVSLLTSHVWDSGSANLRSLHGSRALEALSQKPGMPPDLVLVHSSDITAAPNSATQAIHVTKVNWLSDTIQTKIMITMDGAANFETHRLRDPNRVFVDLHPTRLTPTLSSRKEKIFLVDDALVERVRVAQKEPQISRVVVDLKIAPRYAKASRLNPKCFLITVQGERFRAALQ